jgi:hypothetical protein
MTWTDLYLMALGPVLALVAGLFIYLSATRGTPQRAREAMGAGDSRGTSLQSRDRH